MALRGVGAALENVGQSLTVFSREQMERDAAARAAAQAQAATAAEGEKQRTFQGLMEDKRQAGAVKLQGMEELFRKNQAQQARSAEVLDKIATMRDPKILGGYLKGLERMDPMTYKGITPRLSADLLTAASLATDQDAAIGTIDNAVTELNKDEKLLLDEYGTVTKELTILAKAIEALPESAKVAALNAPDYLAKKAAKDDLKEKLNAVRLEKGKQMELLRRVQGTNPDVKIIHQVYGRPEPGGKPAAPTGEEAPMTSAANADLLAQLVDKGQQAKAAQNLSRPEMEKLLKASEAGKQLSPAQIQLVLDQIYSAR